MCVIKAELLTSREDLGGYVIYVFKNLDSNSWDSKYIMTVRFPNWNAPKLKIGDTGFLEYKEVIAGKDTWWDGNINVPYRYDNIIFQNFIFEVSQENLTVML